MAIKPRYELLLESGPQLNKALQLSQAVQRHLSEVNEEYADKCLSGRLETIAVREVPPGTWAALRAERSRARGNFEEFKQPCLVPDMEYADKLPEPIAPVTSGRVAS